MLKGSKQPFNVLLSPHEHRALQWLAHVRGVSAAQVIRIAVMALANHQQGQPTCANGNACFVPQMHQRNGGLHPTHQAATPPAPPVQPAPPPIYVAPPFPEEAADAQQTAPFPTM